MRLQRLRNFWLAALLAAGFCGSTSGLADEFPPPATVKAQLKTVVMLPVDVPSDTPRHEEVQRRLEEAISARFTSAGITVIPATTTRALEQKLITALGGVYDPRTGDMDKARADTFDEHYFSEIRRSYPADAWVHASIVFRVAPANGAWVQWDGVRESAIGSANTGGDIFKTPSVTGSLPAVSLAVVVLRPDRQPVYGRYGGLQPLQYFAEASAAKSMFGIQQQIDMVPTDEAALLGDPAREQRAIALALDPLLLTQAEQDAAKGANKEAWKNIAPVPKGRPPEKPAPVDRTTFLAKYPRIAVAMPEVAKMPNRAAVRDRYAAAVATALTGAGFVVVPPAAYAAVWDPIFAAAGGFYDPVTGDLLKEKRDQALAAAFAQLGAASPVDAVFLPSVVITAAHIDKGQAKWDGLAMPLGKGGAVFDRSRQFGGTMKAASLELRALDPQLNEVFVGRGGIELLERFKSGGMMSAGGFEDIPDSDWLTNPANDAPAMQRALGPLAAPATPAPQ